MITKREVLEQFAEVGSCSHIRCTECEYKGTGCVGKNLILSLRLQKIGAMAILRMFPEKKKPTLDVGTKIKFSDGRIATISAVDCGGICYYNLNFEDGNRKFFNYLVGRAWEVVE